MPIAWRRVVSKGREGKGREGENADRRQLVEFDGALEGHVASEMRELDVDQLLRVQRPVPVPACDTLINVLYIAHPSILFMYEYFICTVDRILHMLNKST